MLVRTTVAAAAIALISGPALAQDQPCVSGVTAAGCEGFFETYRAEDIVYDDDVPVAAPDVDATDHSVVENYQTFGYDHLGDEHILFEIEDDAQIMAEEAGPTLEIADW